MLELIRKNIHMNRFKKNTINQITLDDDFIVPDSMDDIDQIILDQAEIQIDSMKNLGDRVSMKGKMIFQILYQTIGGQLQTLGGTLPLDELVNIPELEEKDYLSLKYEIEDLEITIINSRKINVKSIVTIMIRVEAIMDAQIVEGAKDPESKQTAEILQKERDAAVISVRKKDTFRIKEDRSLPGNKPDIGKILWYEMKLQGTTVKPLDTKIHLEGDLILFVIYKGESEDTPVQWFEESIPFAGDIDIPDSTDKMTPQIDMRIVHKELEEKPDFDGEMRNLLIDVVLELDIKLYEEEKLMLLEDIYSTDCEIETEYDEVNYDNLLIKNNGKCKISEKVKPDISDQILQICHSIASVHIDDIQRKEDLVSLEGVLDIKLSYLTTEDETPLKSTTLMLPFSYEAEAKNINNQSIIQIDTGIEQMSTIMLSADNIEVKAVLTLDLFILQPVCEKVISAITVKPADLNKIKNLPGIAGYILQPEDRLWDIAKKFHTTTADILAMNQIAEEKVQPGLRLILIKKISV